VTAYGVVLGMGQRPPLEAMQVSPHGVVLGMGEKGLREAAAEEEGITIVEERRNPLEGLEGLISPGSSRYPLNLEPKPKPKLESGQAVLCDPGDLNSYTQRRGSRLGFQGCLIQGMVQYLGGPLADNLTQPRGL
jgi:hypothetical protein